MTERLQPLSKAIDAYLADLERNGSAANSTHYKESKRILRQDDQGRWADFHSFRYFFCTQMGERHPIQKVKELMRHSTITLTMDYSTHLDVFDVAGALDKLPSVPVQAAREPASQDQARGDTPKKAQRA